MKMMQNNEESLLKSHNTILGILAHQKIPCVHCGLENMAMCTRGFPGCAKADDILCSEEDELRQLLDENRSLKERIDTLEGWSKDEPQAPGQYEMKCDEGGNKIERVEVAMKGGFLMANCPDLGWQALDLYHANLCNIRWRPVANGS